MHAATRAPAPALAVATAAGERFDLAASRPEAFTLVVFYRGKHCPICGKQLRELEARLDDLTARGVAVVAVSMDDADRARASAAAWGLTRIALGYGLDIDTAAAWGLRFSVGRSGTAEPILFSEPGLFLVRPDGELYFAATQSAPFTRPPLSELLEAIDYVKKSGYPARGELDAVGAKAVAAGAAG